MECYWYCSGGPEALPEKENFFREFVLNYKTIFAAILFTRQPQLKLTFLSETNETNPLQ